MSSFRAHHVQKAFVTIRQDGIPSGFGTSTKWDIIDEATSERFPPKAVLFLAKAFAGDDSRSGGGGDIGTNNALRERGFEVVLKPEIEHSEEAQDIAKVYKSNEDETTKRRLINARLGQGGFRAELIERWNGECALTGLDVEPILRASHIKAWRDADNRERLDSANGLLLAASVDALFDRYLITIRDDGRVLVCSTIKQASLEQIGLAQGKRITLADANRLYLRCHRAEFEKRGGSGYLF